MKYKVPKVEELFEAGVHFGHQVRSWHPSMEEYIFTSRNNIHIIDLEKTYQKLEEACEFLYNTAKSGGRIIFVGTKKQSRDVVENEAKRCGANYVNERWLGGTISNFSIIKKNVNKLVDMMKKRESGEYDKYTKKERLMLDREIAKLQRNVGGLLGLDNTPVALFVIDPRREKTAVREALQKNIPVVALVDTNSNVTNITYPIPGNDDAIKSAAIIVKSISDAIEEGYQQFAKIQNGEEEKEVIVKSKVKTKISEKKEEKEKEKEEEIKEETKIDVESIEEKIEEELEEIAEEEAEKGKKVEDEDTKLIKEK